MFFLHSSNKTENLLEHLITVLETVPLPSVFDQETFLIQSQGMERWLSQQLAGRLKVWANFDFLFPGKFFGSIGQRLKSSLNDASLDRHLLVWRFESLLRTLDNPVYQPLQHYLQGENAELKRFQLAQQLAKVFDQYQIMRPDLLACWQRGELLYEDLSIEIWQQQLWLELSKQLGNQHRGSLWLKIIDQFNQKTPGTFASSLPKRISIFGVNSMPPLFLDFLQGLARHCDVHLYLLNPSENFWADLETKRQRAKAGIDEVFSGHPLLAALGQQGREFQNMLLNQTEFNLEFSSFEANKGDTVLEHLQNAILSNESVSIALPRDASIGIHACHSRMREVEVIKNLLLDALERDTSLELRDIVIMAPDIQAYEPFIAANFSDLQYAIADRSLKISNAALEAYLRFLHLCQSRFGWQTVLDLLEHPAVYASFGLVEDDLILIKHWCQATQVRWGKSAAHRSELGLPELSQNTWQASVERLLMGYCVGSDQEFVDGVLPFIDIEGSSAQVLGGFYDFLQLLFQASQTLQAPRSLANWYVQLSAYAERLLEQAPPLEKQQLNELLAEFAEKFATVHTEQVSLGVIIHWLESRVSEQKSTNGFLRGQLTFCSMLPMRSIPFKVIVLLGLNEGEFPKIDRAASFDLISRKLRAGDRSSRVDDRYQFLEILLSARQQLLITYLGQSINNNDTIPPSVVVSELLEVLDSQYQLTDLITLHPLQAFSSRYFKANSELFSYASSDCATAMAFNQVKPPVLPWWQGSIAVETEQVIEISELFSYFRHPQKYFLQRQLDLRFNGIAADAEEREPFQLDDLDQYSIQHRWIEALLQGDNFSLAKLQAQGNWLAGSCGELEFMRQQEQLQAFAQQIKDLQLGDKIDDVPLDLKIGSFRLIGTTGHHYQQGCLFYRFAKLKGKDFIVAWLQHLMMNRIEARHTFLLSTDAQIQFLPEHAHGDALEAWLTLYYEGLQSPEAFFSEAAFQYVQQAVKLNTSKSATKPPLVVAEETLSRAIEQSYEPELQLIYRDVADLSQVLGERFEATCRQLLLPVWQAVAPLS